MTALASLKPLFAQVNDLKRLRSASAPGSTAERLFTRSWARLLAGESPGAVAHSEAGAAVIAVTLADIDAAVLRDAGLERDAVKEILGGAFDSGGAAIPQPLAGRLRDAAVWTALDGPAGEPGRFLPAWVDRLNRQPRAGATAPGKPRIVLEPPESHGDHCAGVAVVAVLVCPRFPGADPARAFLAGLCHHLHNAYLPDAGFAGEEALGSHLQPIMRAFFDRALAELPPTLAAECRDTLAEIQAADTPTARAFHAADVIDRVLQMAHYERAARFRLTQALDDLELVHAGPVQAFHQEILAESGVWPC